MNAGHSDNRAAQYIRMQDTRKGPHKSFKAKKGMKMNMNMQNTRNNIVQAAKHIKNAGHSIIRAAQYIKNAGHSIIRAAKYIDLSLMQDTRTWPEPLNMYKSRTLDHTSRLTNWSSMTRNQNKTHRVKTNLTIVNEDWLKRKTEQNQSSKKWSSLTSLWTNLEQSLTLNEA